LTQLNVGKAFELMAGNVRFFRKRSRLFPLVFPASPQPAFGYVVDDNRLP
jgi:hypothetical protein